MHGEQKRGAGFPPGGVALGGLTGLIGEVEGRAQRFRRQIVHLDRRATAATDSANIINEEGSP